VACPKNQNQRGIVEIYHKNKLVKSYQGENPDALLGLELDLLEMVYGYQSYIFFTQIS
jgi:hypothetical protein